MKNPDNDQLRALQDLRANAKAVAYLEAVEQDYLKQLTSRKEFGDIRETQGSVFVIQGLLKHIKSRK